ncbi:LacI family DNA-binding transcriptional regulator [Auraticoccus sp. F435]|uniref:LacI family DNA-binding transcriptional regulator n=1 Tax=Auraticoccus cholistanensis TaxID=2656650 RepID=A0A6A9UP74_9ACTN|nr:LacI family DNA-binding transcriptional regulator [Auraticoccus cholistanensis]MVA74471.1 LacI family DNA-binding transcriptional regulator [Auraticoccus cholistanensis]
MGRSGRATINDVAERAGVSKTAVSKVLNGTGSISPATRARVLQAARDLRWQPSAHAVALRRARSQTVALVLNGHDGPPSVSVTTAELITGIETTLSSRGYGLLLHLVDESRDGEADIYRQLVDAGRVDGAILTDSVVGDHRPALLRELGLPAVLVGTPEAGDPVPHVRTDPRPAIDQAVEHLASLGHRRLGFIGGPRDRVQAMLRREAFEASVRAHGLELSAVVSTAYSGEASARATREVLRGPTPPTALLYGNDTMAIAGIKAARDLGLRTPQDLSVIGAEGLPVGAWIDPPLTTVQRQVVLRGQVAAQLMLRELGIEVPELDWSGDEELLVRGSTAPPPPGS